MPRRSTRGYQATVCVHIVTQSSGFCGDEAYFALQTGVKCRAAEAELVLVRLRWRTHEGEVGLGLPMSLEKEKTKEFAVHACRGASDGRHERDAVIVSVMVAVFVQFPISSFVEWGGRCVLVRESAVKVGVSCAIPQCLQERRGSLLIVRQGCG